MLNTEFSCGSSPPPTLQLISNLSRRLDSFESKPRRVIFPCLHAQLASIIEDSNSSSSPIDEENNSEVAHVSLLTVNTDLKLSPSRATHEAEHNVNTNDNQSGSHSPSLPPIEVEDAKNRYNLELTTESSVKPVLPPVDSQSLIIPPFQLNKNQLKPTCQLSEDAPIQPFSLFRQSFGLKTKYVSTREDPPHSYSTTMLGHVDSTIRLTSILRSKQEGKSRVNFDISDSLPSLASFNSVEKDEENESQCSKEDHLPMMSSSEFDQNIETPARSVNFDPKVSVYEFDRCRYEWERMWFTPDELDNFKMEAVKKVREHDLYELVATGTGRVVRLPIKSKAVYTSPALVMDSVYYHKEDKSEAFKVLESEIVNIMIIDPHEICAQLFLKAMRIIMPHATVVACRSGVDAMAKIQESREGYDMIIVEERLTLLYRHPLLSGSALLNSLSSRYKAKTLFVGVSKHFDQDKCKLTRSGADLVWAKPPPSLNNELRDSILEKLLYKRGKEALALKLFG